jgi:large subunit ribosomal protein L20
MARVKYVVAGRRRRRRVLKAAKGFVGGRRRLVRTARETIKRAGVYAFRDRKARKREFRALWITRINAACRAYGVKYSQFIDALKKAKVALDRKVLADLAVSNKAAFKKLTELVKTKKPAKA